MSVVVQDFVEKTMRAKSDFPPVLPGFENVNRYWDHKFQTITAKILPGEYYVTRTDEVVATVLGSCVAACIRDPEVKVGGMNHFLLPLHNGETWHKDSEILSLASRYGNFAMEHLINAIMKNGGQRDRLEVKIFGGSQVIKAMTNIGANNIRFVRDYIDTENLNLLSEDVGGSNPRKVLYFPETGRVRVKKIRELHNDTIIQREKNYIGAIEVEEPTGEIDFFG